MSYSRDFNFTVFLQEHGVPCPWSLSHWEIPVYNYDKKAEPKLRSTVHLSDRCSGYSPVLPCPQAEAYYNTIKINFSTTVSSSEPGVSIIDTRHITGTFLLPLQQETEKLKQTFYKGND